MDTVHRRILDGQYLSRVRVGIRVSVRIRVRFTLRGAKLQEPRGFLHSNSRGYWTTRGYANSRTGQLADWSTSGQHNSRTSQLADWTSRGLDNSRMPSATLRA